MRKLMNYRLDFSKTLDYFKDRMNGGNCLNNILLENIDLNKGSFFVLLPKKHNHNHLYDFKYGGILPSNPIEDIYITSLNSTFKGEKINSIAIEIASYIHKIITFNNNFTCIFDDVNSTYSENDYDPVFLSHGVHYKKEVYYVVTKAGSSAELIHKCLRYSNAFWHSLGVIIDKKIDFIKKEISLQNLQDICENVKIIFVGAYDGEGYVFWEKDGESILIK